MRKLLVIPVSIAAFLSFGLLARPAHAATTLVSCTGIPASVTVQQVQDSWIKLQVGIPGITAECTDSAKVKAQYVQDMSHYIAGLYRYFVGIIGILAMVMIFYAGIRWMTAAGNASRVKDARDTIFSSIIAIILCAGSYLLLYTISPKLVNLSPPALKVADTIFQRFDTQCETRKACTSGANVGKFCTSDADCGGQKDACQFFVEPLQSGTPSNLSCGTVFTYRDIGGTKIATGTCLGTFCSPDTDGTSRACRNDVDAGKAPTEGHAKCTVTSGSCARTTDTTQCASLSIPGEGECRIIPDGSRCGWYPRLACPSTATEVGCGECNSRNVPLPNSKAVCEVTTAPKYQGTIDSFPAICCYTNIGGNNPNYYYVIGPTH